MHLIEQLTQKKKKKELNESLELKSTISKIKNSLDEHNTSLKMAKGSVNWKKDQEKISKLTEDQREKG